ncbi:lantibiotic dehydratase C-terminal domain-containing protein [Arthrobacter gengyunqii]|uniref:Thiopeptide-type bacteriocin biosynthesis domain-containing protein n=1 Tax=Arthrobacter gengyunqii TaxID=2886940 RepID=A0ABS8GNM7_9MICC|nr:lantibiotic dehydratase C-terminal domain-containing protein [Arthrobacter gengyunqii]MCC3266868.1 hypothetical protein [Arthrobacter gengyunqii]
MSHTTIPRTVEGSADRSGRQRAGKTSLWWALTIEPEEKGSCDGWVKHVVAPLSAQARNWGAARAGFSRSEDENSPSLNINLLAPADVVDRVWDFANALALRSGPTLGSVKLAQTKAITPPWAGGPVPRKMEAALAKYGGMQGMELAGDVAELSSDLAIWAVGRFPGSNVRSPLAALLLFDTCHSMMRGPRSAVWADRRTVSWNYYWDMHLRSCTASYGLRSERAHQTLKDQLAPRIVPAHRIMAALASEPSVDAWRKRWVRVIDNYLYRADKARVSRSAQQMTMTQGRHMLNRLGISVRDEAALGQYARAWTKELEDGLA